ncbi:MAG TPA: DNA polymerase I [Steroidobacteraceae bacterium]|nr:DNA polymerase I [Steroidobacteraceae bacterium]
MSKPKKLWLVDGSSYLYRAFFALPPLSTTTGIPTGAVLGVLSMLNKLLKEEDPELVAIVMDAPGRTFRDDLFEEYKAHRPPMPDDLRAQIDPLIEAIPALGLPLLRIKGVEADDVIGTLAERAAKHGMKVVISTGDKDMAQLVNDDITIVNTMFDTRLDRAGVKAKFDVLPTQIVDYLALVGDSSDNIPGVPKVGPKTAAKWLNEYGSLDEIIKHAKDIPGKVGESLRENLDTLELSKRLATIRCDVELPLKPTELTRTPPDVETLSALYKRLEMNSLLRQLTGTSAQAAGGRDTASERVSSGGASEPVSRPPVPARRYEAITTEKELTSWLKVLETAELFAFDTETTSLDYMQAEIVGMSFCIEPGHAAYLPLAHDYPGAPDQLDRKKTLARLKSLLESDKHPKVGHHLKYDAHVLLNHGIRLGGMRYDSMLESYVLNSSATRHDMDSCAKLYLDVDTIKYEDVAGKGAKQIPFNQVALEQATEYAAEDADVTLQLHNVLLGALKKQPHLLKVYEEIEQPLVPVLLEMEHRGVLVDRAKLRKQSGELAKRLAELEADAHKSAGQPFNLDSPKQLQEILFNKLGLPVGQKTRTGQPSTSEDVLEELAEKYLLPRIILEYRGLAKLRSTYTEKLPEQVDEKTGRVHTSYHQAVAVTGRLSSSDPNLQNIPVRTPEGRRIRQAFIAPKGYVLLSADYSQIELRIMAHLSGDEGLRRAFADDGDIHRATAAEVFDTKPEKVTADQRRAAKAINFGLIYGMSAFGLARQLGIERHAAQEYVARYFGRYPAVREYMDRTREQARSRGYVETAFGRRLYLPDIRSRDRNLQQYAERSAINAPMQGTAADIIKRAMIGVHAWLAESKVAAHLVMQVHDELVLEVANAAVEKVRKKVVEIMSGAAELSVALKVDTGSGPNWDDAH